MAGKLVSVITPCYNLEKCIAVAIESVIAQIYTNWEMLVIDDSSSDNSADVIKKYALKDSRIKYLRTEKPSGSPALPRNIGIENAMGKYIAFLDADDVWVPEKLQLQVDFLEKNGYDLVYSFYEKINWDGIRNNRIVQTHKESIYKNLLKSNSIPCSTSIVKREAIGKTRFKQIPQEDFCFWLDILKKGYIAHNLCKVTTLYREAKTSRSANKFNMFKGYWNVIRKHQHIKLFPACYYMLTYTMLGFAKYLK